MEDGEKVNDIKVERIRRLRRIFDKKVDLIMEKYDYVDIDEGEFEAVTEEDHGIIFLFTKDRKVHWWGYAVHGDDVKLFKLGDW